MGTETVSGIARDKVDPWLADQPNVVRLESSTAIFSAGSLLPAHTVVVFPHSPKVPAVRPSTERRQ